MPPTLSGPSPEYPIDKGIPIPRKSRKTHRPSGVAVYPWNELTVGDSFFAPGKTIAGMGAAAHSWRAKAGKYTSVKFEMRTLTEKGRRGIRVWRIE